MNPQEEAVHGRVRWPRGLDSVGRAVSWALLIVMGALSIYVAWMVLREYTLPLVGSLLLLFQIWLYFRLVDVRREIEALRSELKAAAQSRRATEASEPPRPGPLQ